MEKEVPAIRKAGATWASLSREAQRGANLHGHTGSEGQPGGSVVALPPPPAPSEQGGSIRKQLSPRGSRSRKVLMVGKRDLMAKGQRALWTGRTEASR